PVAPHARRRPARSRDVDRRADWRTHGAARREAMSEHTPRPPIVDGVPEPRRGDALRIVWWSQRGYRHGARHGRGAGRAFSTLLAIVSWLVIPLSIAVQAYRLSR